MSEKAMVLCSGGVDSTTCLALAIEKHGKENVCALSIYYGQKHVKEIQAAKAVLEYYGIEGTSLDLTPVFAYSDCSLLSHSTEDIPEESYAEQLAQRGGKPVTTYVPFRNGLFLSAAASVALSKNCSVIYYGAHHDDAAGNAYPDCSEEFVNAMNHSIVLGSGGDVRIEAPFVRWNKAQIVAEGLRLRGSLSADVELRRGRRQAVRQVRHLSGPHPRVRGERCDRPCNEVKQKTAVSSETAVFFCPS